MKKLLLLIPLFASLVYATPPVAQSLGKVSVKSITFPDTTVLTSTAALGGGGGTPGGTNGQVQFNNGGTFGGDSNLTYSSSTTAGLTVSSVTIGNVQILTVADNSFGIPVYKMRIVPTVDQNHIFQIYSNDGAPMFNVDTLFRRVGVLTVGPSQAFEVAGNAKIQGQTISDGGLKITNAQAPYNYNDTVTLVAGAAMIPSGVVKTTSNIFLTHKVPGGTLGTVYVSSITAAVSINILSTSVADTSTISYMIVDTQ